MNDYGQWEKDCAVIRRQNEEILSDFAEWLKESRLKEASIKKHCENVDFYINEYLLYYGVITAKDGVLEIGDYFGDWFIRKALWSSSNSIKQNVVSIKKFYQFMTDKNEISLDDYLKMENIIKEEMSNWLIIMKRYADLDIEDLDEVWGIK